VVVVDVVGVVVEVAALVVLVRVVVVIEVVVLLALVEVVRKSVTINWASSPRRDLVSHSWRASRNCTAGESNHLFGALYKNTG